MGSPVRGCSVPGVQTTGDLPDWQDAAAYAPLLGADRSIFAWEWLRRDSSYRRVAGRSSGRVRAGGAGVRRGSLEAERWGLHAFEPGNLAAPAARPVWSAATHPAVLPAVSATAADPEDVFALERFAPLATVVANPRRGEHLLLSDGLRSIRLDLPSATLASAPAALEYRISGIVAAERPLLTLRRLLALLRTGRFSRSLHPPEPRARRWVLLLRAHDALAAGADQRAIASILLSRSAAEPRWRSRASSLRSQAQRLVAGARRMAAGGYRELLR